MGRYPSRTQVRLRARYSNVIAQIQSPFPLCDLRVFAVKEHGPFTVFDLVNRDA